MAFRETAAEEIIRTRRFSSLRDFYNKVNRRVVNKRIMDAAILAGALGSDIKSMMNSYYMIKEDKMPEPFTVAKGSVLSLNDSPRVLEKAMLRENFL